MRSPLELIDSRRYLAPSTSFVSGAVEVEVEVEAVEVEAVEVEVEVVEVVEVRAAP
jgi:hypothetical protein